MLTLRRKNNTEIVVDDTIGRAMIVLFVVLFVFLRHPLEDAEFGFSTETVRVFDKYIWIESWRRVCP